MTAANGAKGTSTASTTAEVAALRAENERLRSQLARLLADLRDRTEVSVRVDLDAGPDEEMVRVEPAPRSPLGGGGLVEVHEVAERLAHVQRDMRRIEQQVEKLLWRVGDPAPPLAATDVV